MDKPVFTVPIAVKAFANVDWIDSQERELSFKW